MKAEESKEGQAQVPSFSLPAHFYLDEKQYRDDVKWLKESLWLPVDHESRIPHAGDFFVYEFDKANVIIIRDHEGRVRAHHNVCRHRGSRICLESSGSKQALICPYHAWNFSLDGRLRAAAYMPKDFDKEQHGLIPCHVSVYCGLIFISFAREAPDFSTFIRGFTRELEFNDIRHARSIQRSSFVTAANWKLVVQNNNECYHCRVAHPTYWAAHPDTLVPRTNEGDYGRNLWEPKQESDSEKARQFHAISDGEDSPYLQTWSRHVIGGNFLTESVGGTPVAPLMGRATYDGVQTIGGPSRLTTLVLNPDYAIIMNFIPRAVRHTDIEIMWLVKHSAVEGIDFMTSRVTSVFDATVKEDKTIVENNQLGVESDEYRPGRYSRLEAYVGTFDRWYLRNMGPHQGSGNGSR